MTIANPHFAEGAQDHALSAHKRRAAAASVSVGLILIAVKTYAYAVTHSVSLLSSLLDSLFDTIASLITVVSVMHAAQPADRQHRYGHGKVEAISALAQAAFVFVSAGFLLVEAGRRLVTPVPVEAPLIGIGVTVFSIFLTLGLVAYQIWVVRRTQSIAIHADHLHYKGDLLMNIGVIAAIAITALTGMTAFDTVFAIGIAFYLLAGVWRIVSRSFDILMDRELPRETREKIRALIHNHPAAAAIHDLRTRDTGDRICIEFHLELDGNMTLTAAHDVTEEIEKIIFDAFPASEVIIHQEPAGIDDHRLDDRIRRSEGA